MPTLKQLYVTMIVIFISKPTLGLTVEALSIKELVLFVLMQYSAILSWSINDRPL